MYALVYAPQGIVGEDGSSVRLFATHEEAYDTMHREALYDPEVEDCYADRPDEVFIDKWHATNNIYYPDSAEWAIYKV